MGIEIQLWASQRLMNGDDSAGSVSVETGSVLGYSCRLLGNWALRRTPSLSSCGDYVIHWLVSFSIYLTRWPGGNQLSVHTACPFSNELHVGKFGNQGCGACSTNSGNFLLVFWVLRGKWRVERFMHVVRLCATPWVLKAIIVKHLFFTYTGGHCHGRGGVSWLASLLKKVFGTLRNPLELGATNQHKRKL